MTEHEYYDDKVIELSTEIVEVLANNNPEFSIGMSALCLALGQAAITWEVDIEDAVEAVRKCMNHIYNSEKETMQ